MGFSSIHLHQLSLERPLEDCLAEPTRTFQVGFNEEFARAANAEGVIGGFGGTTDLDGVFENHVLVTVCVALLVINVPAEHIEEGFDEFTASLGLVVFQRAVGGELGGELVD